MNKEYDIIVVGAGHAGCEAALASARMGCRTLCLTMNIDHIAKMSCNPAIGGPAKSQLVSEIDALGGEMGRAADQTALQFKLLNISKGAAVQSLRVQCDMAMYHIYMRNVMENEPNLDIKQAEVCEILVSGRKNLKIRGIITNLREKYLSSGVILTTGTFLKGLIHIGMQNFPAGRSGDLPAQILSGSLIKYGVKLGRLKTGTTPRLDGRTIDFKLTKLEQGDKKHPYFSFTTEKVICPDLPCHVVYTNSNTHNLIKKNLRRSPLYTGKISGIGPRYCPSIEDKVVRFADKEKHQIFLEPEGNMTNEIYPAGFSTSLPYDVQLSALRTIKGLEHVEIQRPGYAIEYDYIIPSQIRNTLEVKQIKGLYSAGQLNGTSGYEEAAAQGLYAGINCALQIKNKLPMVLSRMSSYLGTMIDDIINKEIIEPYRMFTARSEYRLLLRQDNADLRLTDIGYQVGLIIEERYQRFVQKKNAIDFEIKRLSELKINPNSDNINILSALKEPINRSITLKELIRRPGMNYFRTEELDPQRVKLPATVINQVEINIKYDGYIQQILHQIKDLDKLEQIIIPKWLDYEKAIGLRSEAKNKLILLEPENLGIASRIAGVNPTDIAILIQAIKRKSKFSKELS